MNYSQTSASGATPANIKKSTQMVDTVHRSQTQHVLDKVDRVGFEDRKGISRSYQVKEDYNEIKV